MLVHLLPIRCQSRKVIHNTICVIRHFHTAERKFSTSYGSDGKTVVNVLNQMEDSPIMIDSYSQVGFRLNNGLFILGPMVMFPTSVLAWNVANDDDITLDSLSLFLHLEPRPDVLVVGMGDTDVVNAFDNRIMKLLYKEKMCAEVLPTDRACATFNFLNSEKRFVAAALIPPRRMIITEADAVNAHLKRQNSSKSYFLG